MKLSPKLLTGVEAKETPSRLPRPTNSLLSTPTLNHSANSTPHVSLDHLKTMGGLYLTIIQYGNSKIPRPQAIKALPPIPFNVDSLKPLPSSPAQTPSSTPKPVLIEVVPQKRLTARLQSRTVLNQQTKGLKRDDSRSEGSRKSLTAGSIDYTYVKKLKESSVAGNGPTLRISEDAEDIIFGPLDTVWSNVTAKLKLKSSPTSSKRVSPNTMKYPSDQAFGFPVWLEDAMSENGRLTSTKVASNRDKALAFLEGKILPLFSIVCCIGSCLRTSSS
jgi:hypothetical protein